jgi:DMSO reductase anchor subunit
MHPAFSVIFFTTSSGIGYGLLMLLGVLMPLDLLPNDRAFGGAVLGAALAAVSGGLLASTAHLARPERAWRAFSQWRSSWLSREGVASVATYGPALCLVALWPWLGRNDVAATVAAVLTGTLAATSLLCTAMIYRSLQPIQRWANHWTVPVYFMLALATGALWLDLIAAATGHGSVKFTALALGLVIAAAIVKESYWRFIDNSEAVSTAESATGLGDFGKVRLLDAPNTSENYLMKEMGYRIARKHAARLRRLAWLMAFAAPIILLLLGLPFGSGGRFVMALLAAPLATAGVLIERWLFFAEAKHTVSLYYGASKA